jgi:hypothetical protein
LRIGNSAPEKRRASWRPDHSATLWQFPGRAGKWRSAVQQNYCGAAGLVPRRRGVDSFLEQIWKELNQRNYVPLPARRQEIPKDGGKVRVLSIPAIRDPVVQGALKLILERLTSLQERLTPRLTPLCAPLTRRQTLL